MIEQVIEKLKVVLSALDKRTSLDMDGINHEFINIREGIIKVGVEDISGTDTVTILSLLDEIEVKFHFLKLTSWSVDSTRELFYEEDDDGIVTPD